MKVIQSMALGLTTVVLLCGSSSAQYGGGTMGGTTGAPGATGGSPSYGGNGKAIGIGVGAAAGGAGLLYLAMHHHGAVNGCVSETNDRLNLTEEKTGKTYSLLSADSEVKSGERFELTGKKSTDAAGASTFEVKKVVKNLGACR